MWRSTRASSLSERLSAIGRPGLRLPLVARSRVALVGLGLVAFGIAVASFAPLIAPYPPNANDFLALADPTPSATHWLGTDNLGRDILSRIIWGARTVLTVAPIALA